MSLLATISVLCSQILPRMDFIAYFYSAELKHSKWKDSLDQLQLSTL